MRQRTYEQKHSSTQNIANKIGLSVLFTLSTNIFYTLIQCVDNTQIITIYKRK